MQTIVAAFDDRQSAQSAVERLVQQGFSRSAVHMQAGYDADTSSSGTGTESHTGFLAGVENFFANLFGEDDSATDSGKYAEAVRRGSHVVVVDTASDAEVMKARQLLGELGSVDVDQRAEQWKSKGWTGFDATAKPLSKDEMTADRGTVMPVVQEELQVGKRAVEGGVVRVVKRVSETPISEMIKLRQETATIERRPVDRAATEADFSNFKEGTIEVREMSEQAVVGKTARVVEEVVVGKKVTERDEQVSDTVRRTDVEVERVPGKTETGSTANVGSARMPSSGAAASTGFGGTAGTNQDQAAGLAKQREGAAKDAAGSSGGSLAEKIEGKAEKVAGKVQEGYGNVKQDVTRKS